MSGPHQSNTPEQAVNTFIEDHVLDWDGLSTKIVGPEFETLDGGRIAFEFLALRRSGFDGSLTSASRYQGQLVRRGQAYDVESWDRTSIPTAQFE